MKLQVDIEKWPLKSPFRIAGCEWSVLEVVVVTLDQDGVVGRGEAAGVYYRNETAQAIKSQLESHRADIEIGMTRDSLQRKFPPGGARNALDCAFWDLQARNEGRHAWQAAGLEKPRPLLTTFTCGADAPQAMAAAARGYVGAKAIKLKLTGDAIDADRVKAVREALPGVWLSVDANQALTQEKFERLLPTLVSSDVQLVEQPFQRGQENLLDGLNSPIPIALDESVQGLNDIAPNAHRCKVINIKLDKCGGLTEGLEMARTAHRFGLDAMVGNMLGTSLAMAPAYLVGQLCEVVDLDGPTFLRSDRSETIRYVDGHITCPEEVWG